MKYVFFLNKNLSYIVFSFIYFIKRFFSKIWFLFFENSGFFIQSTLSLFDPKII